MRKKGFTLIELLIYMGLLSILMVVMTQIFVSVLDVRLEAEAVTSVERDGNFIMSRLIYDISRSSSITTPSGAGGQGNTLVIVIDGQNYTYALNGNNLELTTSVGTSRLNGYNSYISNLNFKRVGPGDYTDTIQITLTVTSQTVAAKGREFKTYQTTVSSRQ